MNLAIWKKSFYDAMWLLIGCAVLMFVFLYLFVYFASLITASSFVTIVDELPGFVQGLVGIPLDQAASWQGRLALAFIDPTVILISAIWAISRSSDAVSGPLDRGTMEMVLAQPVSRRSLLFAHSAVTLFGAAVIAVAAWFGLWLGISIVSVEEPRTFLGLFSLSAKVVPMSSLTQPSYYGFSVFNLFALTVFTAGLATLVSSCGRYRWRTIGIMGGFYVVQIVVKAMASMSSEQWSWLYKLTFLGAYWPQVLATEAMQPESDAAWRLSFQYNGILLGLAAVCFIAASIIFHRRDLPAPV